MRKPDWIELRDTPAMFPIWIALVFLLAIPLGYGAAWLTDKPAARTFTANGIWK